MVGSNVSRVANNSANKRCANAPESAHGRGQFDTKTPLHNATNMPTMQDIARCSAMRSTYINC